MQTPEHETKTKTKTTLPLFFFPTSIKMRFRYTYKFFAISETSEKLGDADKGLIPVRNRVASRGTVLFTYLFTYLHW